MCDKYFTMPAASCVTAFRGLLAVDPLLYFIFGIPHPLPYTVHDLQTSQVHYHCLNNIAHQTNSRQFAIVILSVGFPDFVPHFC